jgi:uncharacterized protein YqeY
MIIDDIKDDIKALRKARKTTEVGQLKTLLGELETDAKRDNTEIDDATCVAKVKKFIKGIEETVSVLISSSDVASTDGLADLEAEKSMYALYLPPQMTEQELRSLVTKILVALPKEAQNMGLIMKTLKANHEGTYDGKLASVVVKSVLGNL